MVEGSLSKMNRTVSKPGCIFIIKRNGLPYRWVVKTTIEKERRYVGCFDTEAKAIEAWNVFAMKNGMKERVIHENK
jgi:hypothetical protein